MYSAPVSFSEVYIFSLCFSKIFSTLGRTTVLWLVAIRTVGCFSDLQLFARYARHSFTKMVTQEKTVRSSRFPVKQAYKHNAC